jgi:hypothetical protein
MICYPILFYDVKHGHGDGEEGLACLGEAINENVRAVAVPRGGGAPSRLCPTIHSSWTLRFSTMNALRTWKHVKAVQNRQQTPSTPRVRILITMKQSPIIALFGTLPQASQHFWSPRYNIPNSQFFAFVLFMSLWFSDRWCFGIFVGEGAWLLSLYFIPSWLVIICHGGHASFVLLIMLNKTMCSFVMLDGCHWLSFRFSHVETNSALFVGDSDRLMTVGYPAGHIFPWQSTRVALWV